MSQYDVCFLCDMTLFTFSCELPLLPKGPFLLTQNLYAPAFMWCSAFTPLIFILLLYRSPQKPSQPLATAFCLAEERDCGSFRPASAELVQGNTCLYRQLCTELSLLLLAQIMCKDTLTADLCHCIKKNQGNKV